MRVVAVASLLLVASAARAQPDTRVAMGVLDLENGTIPAPELRKSFGSF